MQTAFGSAWFGSEHVDLMATTQTIWDIFWNKIQPQQRFMEESSDIAKIGSNVGPTAAKSVEVKFSLIKLNPEMGTDCKQAKSRAAVTTERENTLAGDATVWSASNAKMQSVAEMITPTAEAVSNKNVMALKWNGASITVDQYAPSGNIYGMNTKHIQFWISTLPKYQLNYGCPVPEGTIGKSSLIDSNAEMPTRAKQAEAVQAERLNKKTSPVDDAIVRSASNNKMQKTAEMTVSAVIASNKNVGFTGSTFGSLEQEAMAA